MKNTKFNYEEAEIEIVLFTSEDIITTSDGSGAFDGEDDDLSW